MYCKIQRRNFRNENKMILDFRYGLLKKEKRGN